MSNETVESVYAVLGFADHEAMVVKAGLAGQISDIIAARDLTQAQAAEQIGMPQSTLANMLRGQFRGLSEARMMDCLAALGRDVDIVVEAAPEGRPGRVSGLPVERRRPRAIASEDGRPTAAKPKHAERKA